MYKVTLNITLARGIGFLQEVLFGMKTVQMYRAEEQVEQRYQGYTDEGFYRRKKINKYDAILFSFISGIASSRSRL
ncbi:hypothetical protein O9929_24060 [Vibrio lentus]|nr:hypothetical protein [Vibrio lentus]